MSSRTVTQGDYLTVTVDAASVDQNTQNVVAFVRNTDQTVFRGGYGAENGVFRIPTLSLEPGSYILIVNSSTPGYNPAPSSAVFTVTAPADGAMEDVNLCADIVDGTVLTNQSVAFSGYTPGADSVSLRFLENPNDDPDSDYRFMRGEYIDAFYSWPQEGTKYVKMVAEYYNEAGYETKTQIMEVRVSTLSGKTTPAPYVTVPDTLTVGEDLVVNLSYEEFEDLIPGAVQVNLFDEYGDFNNDLGTRQIAFSEDKTASCTFDAECFELGGVYRVSVETKTLGNVSKFQKTVDILNVWCYSTKAALKGPQVSSRCSALRASPEKREEVSNEACRYCYRWQAVLRRRRRCDLCGKAECRGR